MNQKTAKQIRRALGLKCTPTQYEEQKLRVRLAEISTPMGEVELQPVQITQPMRLRRGSPRQLYKTMKRLERTQGLDKIFNQLEKETRT